MSIEASWDLLASEQPRSLCVFAARDHSSSSAAAAAAAAASSSYNPFDAAVSEASSNAIAVVFGTEKGSLHYRTFAQTQRLAPSSSPVAATSRSTAVQSPLGSSKTTASSTDSSIPRSYYPVDLTTTRLPGSVVVCRQLSPQVFLLLVDDHEHAADQPSTTNKTTTSQYWAAHLAALDQGHWRILTMPSSSSQKLGASHAATNLLPRMTGAVWSKATGLVYTAGRTLATFSLSGSNNSKLHTDLHQLGAIFWPQDTSSTRGAFAANSSAKQFTFQATLPAPGARSGAGSLALTASGQVVVFAVGSTFYAVAGTEVTSVAHGQHGYSEIPTREPSAPISECFKILSFAQSSQVHPVIVLEVSDPTLEPDWSLIFLANGRDCAVVDLYYSYPSPRVSASKRHGHVTCASPILSAAASWPWIVILTSDGLVSIRSPSCLAISLRTVEIGRPNDYFCLRSLTDQKQTWIVAASYSGTAKVLQCHADTAQDLSDRLMRHAIDAFGASGFPRIELAEAVHASFTATSYVGPEPSQQARSLLQQYLEAVLGLTEFASGGKSGWPTEVSPGNTTKDVHHGALTRSTMGCGSVFHNTNSITTPDAFLAGSALFCLVCMQVSPPQSSLASRAAVACAEKIGIVLEGTTMNISTAAQVVCEMVGEKMLKESSSLFTLMTGPSPTPISRGPRTTQASIYTEFVEAAIWLLRACGKHERAIEMTYERLHRGQPDSLGGSTRGTWSKIKYESYTATHLSDLWASGNEAASRLVISSPATKRLLEVNPRLGLSVFTAAHPQNEAQWRSMREVDDPLSRPDEVKSVIELLKSIVPATSAQADGAVNDKHLLPLESGRALVVTFLESATGIECGRPTDSQYDSLPADSGAEARIADVYDELSFLLLEGIISERRDDDHTNQESVLGKLYHDKLLKLLKCPFTKIRAERFIETLPSSFLQEKALVLGRLDRHEDALRILCHDLQSLELALEYCDDRHDRLKAKFDACRTRQQESRSFADEIGQLEQTVDDDDNVYLPLIRVALDSDDKERGTAAAIQVLALRGAVIDRAAALRLLPSGVPVSAVARPFLIPALVDSESQVRRLTVMSALLRSRYLRLKGQLTSAQLQVQSNLHTVPQLKNLDLGEPLHSTNPFRARTSTLGSSVMPDVMIVKHFFHRYLVVQAKITNSVGLSDHQFGRTFANIAFVVAESSDEAIQPLVQVPIQQLPPKMTGYAWCVLSASPSRMEGPTALLTCELRYTVQSGDAMGGLGGPLTSAGSTHVEELQDLEVHSAHFA